ncbi:MAG: DUF1538 domain-containing protein [Methylocystaceae bacterium]|nr:DUF1538 domain-containing protein [Methylocystaceae bacterium]
MLDWIISIFHAAVSTGRDVLPIIAILLGFQFFIIRKKVPNFRKIIIGFIYVLLGLTLFLVGLEQALFPLGETMATQLSNPEFLGSGDDPSLLSWDDYYWVYIFAAAIGFSTTVAEPSLIAVAIKAQDISGGKISAWGLRASVALGVAIGVSLGAFRIVTGTPLPTYIMIGYIVVIIQTFFAAKTIIPLAYDSGGVTTSTVTVPVVAALGLGLASTVPGRSPLLDGFGLIAFASVFPIMSVLAYALLAELLAKRAKAKTDASSSRREE